MSDPILPPLGCEQRRVLELAAACFERAAAHFRRRLTVPEVRFDLRGACAGQAVFRRTGRSEQIWLRFNPALLQQNPEEFFRQVVAHEAAHVIARQIYGRGIKPHGVEWKTVMRDVLDTEPEVRHRMDVRTVIRHQRQYRYSCGCADREHALSSIRHNRVQRLQQIYLCRSCRLPLKYLAD